MARYAGALSALALVSLAFASTAFALTPVGVRTTRLTEVEPAAAPGYLAWTQNSKVHPNRFSAFVRPQSGSSYRVNRGHTTARTFGGAIDGTTLVYTQWPHYGTQNGDLKFFDLLTQTRSAPSGVNTRKSENGASLSGDWLLFRRTAFGTSTERIILRNLLTQEQVLLDVTSGRRYAQPGNVAGNYAVWYRCPRLTLCNTYLYDIGATTVTKLSNPGARAQYAPSVTADGTVYLFESSNNACKNVRPRLFRYELGQPREKLLVLPRNRDPAVSSALVHGDGTTTLYFDRFNCRTDASDIYKVNIP